MNKAPLRRGIATASHQAAKPHQPTLRAKRLHDDRKHGIQRVGPLLVERTLILVVLVQRLFRQTDAPK